MTTEPTSITALLAAVSRAVGVVGKNQRNEQQHYTFRGIDDLLNACHGPLNEYGIVIVPNVVEAVWDERPARSGGIVTVARVKVDYAFRGPNGDALHAIVWGEGHDHADKATNKAMSAALKYALIQTLAIPTADMDDADRVTLPRPAPLTADEIRAEVADLAAHYDKTLDEFTKKWRTSQGLDWEGYLNADAALLLPYLTGLRKWAATHPKETQ